MNKMIFTSIAAVAVGLMGSPIRAEAGHSHHDHDDEVVAAVGGFIGGVIVGSAIHGNTPPVAVGVSYGHEHRHHHRHGSWEWRTVRVWVPGYWTRVERDCGRTRKVWVKGYYDYRRERVWVGERCNSRCG